MTAAPQCSNCLFSFIAPPSADTTNNAPNRTFAGQRFCNRQPPQPPNNSGGGWLWPLVADDWWCGSGADAATGLSYNSTLNGVPGANGAGYGGTSSTSLAITNTGSVSATITANLAYTAGARVRFTSTSTGAWMEGVVSAYTPGTGAMTFTADTSSGSGTHTDWDINIAGQPGSGGVRSTGSFTLTTTPLVVNDPMVLSSSKIVLQPTNVAAANLCAGLGGSNPPGTASGPYIVSIVDSTSFTVACGEGAPAATETFAYIIA